MNGECKNPKRRSVWSVAAHTVVSAALGLATPTVAGVVSPQPGEVYREYKIVMPNATEAWRVTDPNTTNAGAQAELPNPTFSFNIASGELDHALRAELLISYWGGHPGTIGAKFRLNSNAWVPIPSLTTTPQPPTSTTAPECYMQQWNPVAPVQLAHLRVGSNTLLGTSGNQTCFSFNWGQWGWYAAILRVYYNPGLVANPTGTVVSPVVGTTLLDNPTFSVQATGGGGIERVEFLARTDDYDFDGDGVFVDFQQSYHRGKAENGLEISRHVGTDKVAPYSVVWNTELVPDQAPASIQVVARIRGNNGLWYVTPAVGGLTLARTDRSVRLFKPENVPSRFWTRSARPVMSSKVTIPSTLALGTITSAKLLIRTWNGVDGAGPGTHFTKVNSWKVPQNYGENHYYSADVLDVSPAALISGQNTISIGSSSTHHGIEILWPGPALVVTFGGQTAPYCGDGDVNPGEQCDDGNLVAGDGCEPGCTTTPAAAGLPALFAFEDSGTSVLDVSGNGHHGVLQSISASAARVSTGRYGSALQFNGVAGNVNLGGLDIPGSEMTLAAWIKADDFGIEDARIISKAVSVLEQDHYWMISTRADNNNPRLRLRLRTSSGGTATLEATSRLTAGTWTHVAATYNGSQMRLYQDGALVASASKTGSIAQSGAAPAWIGDHPGGGKSFDGTIDEVVIDSRAYTAAQILERMAQPMVDDGTPACGDGSLDSGEDCDDGNTTSGDGCQADCTDPACGDGIQDPGEFCDDGNTTNGDGCRANCTLEVCGDGVVDPGEACDDGNLVTGDGCEANCTSTSGSTGLPAQFPFDGTGLTMLDVSGNGNHGTLQNATATATRVATGRYGSGLQFNGVAGNVNLGGLNIPGSGMTLAAWIKADDFGIEDARIISKAVGPTDADHYWMLSTRADNSNPRLRVRLKTSSGGTATLEANGGLIAGTWTHVAATYNGSELRLYQDGALVASAAKTGTIAQHASAAAWIGDQPAGGGKTFDGTIDEVVIDSRAYAQVELLQRMITPLGEVSGQACGNGLLDPGELCDDGNNTDGDGCQADCTDPACGDGILDGGEICDDGNSTIGDGCRPNCTREICGDGFLDPGEACDDGNNLDGDGCSAVCVSTESCGDGVIDHPIETCDPPGSGGGQPDACRSDCSYCGDGNLDSPPTPSETVVDGGIEQWILGVPDRWVGTGAGGLVIRSTSECFAGVSCVMLRRQRAGVLRLYQNLQGLQPGREYVLSFRAKTKGGVTAQNPAVKLQNVTRSEFLQGGGNWSATDGYAIYGGLVGVNVWKAFTVRFTTAPNSTMGDTYRLALWHGNPSNTTIDHYYDAVSLFGPEPDRAVQEQCDDGNNSNGDGCSAACTLETCGDGALDPGEACDDGDNVGGDGCSATCTIESFCGDGDLDPGEGCDDGNNTGGDGCSASCTIEPFCGDGDLDPGEGCDDGNNAGGDGCSATCTAEPFCGDGDLDPGEGCDDGNNAGGDGCSATCTAEPFCGDGDLDPGEGCDDGNNTGSDGCSANCTIEPFCGDSDLDAGETCDDGNNVGGDGCSATCTLECGDGDVDPGEECDDGNTDDGDGCSPTCTLPRAVCGDGIVDFPLETCDPAAGDGLSSACRQDCSYCGDAIVNEPPASRQWVTDSGIEGWWFGNTIHWTRTQNGGTAVNNPAQQHSGLSSLQLRRNGSGSLSLHQDLQGLFPGQRYELSFWFKMRSGQTGFRPAVLLKNMTRQETLRTDGGWGAAGPGLVTEGIAQLDTWQKFVVRFDTPATHAVEDTYRLALYHVTPGAPDHFYDDVEINGPLAEGPNFEACDDGNTLAGDGCRPDCTLETCGDGILDPGEDCDDGNSSEGDGCSSACMIDAACGDGVVLPPYETCDPGLDDAGLPNDCRLDCSYCGDGQVDVPPAPSDWMTDPGFEAWSSGTLAHWTPFLTGGAALRNQVEQHSGQSAIQLTRSKAGALGVFSDLQGLYPGQIYELSLWFKMKSGETGFRPAVLLKNMTRQEALRTDGGWGSAGPGLVTEGIGQLNTWQRFVVRFEIPVTHSAEDTYRVALYHLIAGAPDHFYDDVQIHGPLAEGPNFEACDDGNALAGDGCRPDCTVETCGDGILDPGEDCDDGNTTGGDNCSPTCVIDVVCGDGQVDLPFETCDPGAPDAGLPSDCRLDCSYCGDGAVDVPPLPRDWMTDAGFEAWSSSTPAHWTRFQSGGAVHRDQVGPYAGQSALRLARSGVGALGVFQDMNGLYPGHVYELSFWFKLQAGEAGFRPAVLFKNMTNQQSLLAGGGWGVAGPGLITDGIVHENAWQRFVVRFETPVSHGAEDTYRLALYHLTAGAADHYYDDVQVFGPLPGGPNFEACDDGNALTGDGCRPDCTSEVCGDGIVDAGEACDDGNTTDGDGCSSGCSAEHQCGDGVVSAPYETCDPAGVDGCRADCTSCGDGNLDFPGPATEILRGGGLDQWVGGLPAHWNGTVTGGTLAASLTEQQSGAACATLRRGQSGLLRLYQDFAGLTPGKTYEVSFWAKVRGGVTPFNPQARIQNLARSLWLNTTGSWLSTQTSAVRGGIGQENVWQRFSLRFQTPADHSAADTYRLELLHANPSLTTIDHFYDNVSLFGPLPLELCDDGNTADGDGCSAECQLE